MSPLEDLIRARIAEQGPITVAEFMELSLGHPEHGYYMSGDPFGASGDFVTAPEISQVFGELIGLWAAVTWDQLGQPANISVIECGPGRGTLMADLLRAAKSIPAFFDSIDIHLVETSPALRARQRETLHEFSPVWHDSLETVPAGPTILIANEFLDALPVRQLVRLENGWGERRVDVGPQGLTFVTDNTISSAHEFLPAGLSAPAPGTICEISPACQAFADRVSKRLTDAPGSALFIDYGHDVSGTGETLQAVSRHEFADALSTPGRIDLTAHVDFSTFGARFRSNGHRVFGPISQAEFLDSLGIGQRTDDLLQNATPDQAAAIRAGTDRLIGAAEMGNLFRVMVASRSDASTPAGFEAWMEQQC